MARVINTEGFVGVIVQNVRKHLLYSEPYAVNCFHPDNCQILFLL